MKPLFEIGNRPKYGFDPETGRLNAHPDFWKPPERDRYGRPSMGPATPDWMKPPEERRVSLPEWAAERMPTSASRDWARAGLHGLGRTGNMILKFIDIPNRVFGNTRSVLQDVYEKSEANLERDAYEDGSGVPQVGETVVHLASAGVLGKALPAVFGANVGADTYETAKYAGESESEAVSRGIAHGVVDTMIWTLGQGLASKYLPKAWQWLGRELTGAMRGAASSVMSDAMLNSMGADISGDEMAKRAVHAAWMVPLLGMLKMGGGKRKEALAILAKARPDLAGAKAERVIEVLENEFSDRNSQVTALQWVARKGANLPDDIASIKGAIEAYGRAQDTVKAIPHMRRELEGLAAEPPKADPKDEAKRQARIERLTRNLEAAERLNEDFASGPALMKRSPFEIISNENYARFLPRPNPRDVKAFSNMKRYPMGVIGFDVSDDAAGRQATREMINAYMSPSSNPWCLATGKGAAKLGELGPDAEHFWKGHSAVPKQIFFQDVEGDGRLELIAFRATSSGGEGRQEYWDTSDAGYSGIPIKVKVPGDPMGRYRKMVFRPKATYSSDADRENQLMDLQIEREQYERDNMDPDGYMTPTDRRYLADLDRRMQELRDVKPADSTTEGEVQGTFEDIAPGKVFKGDPFRDGSSKTWVRLSGERLTTDLTGGTPGRQIHPNMVIHFADATAVDAARQEMAELVRRADDPSLSEYERANARIRAGRIKASITSYNQQHAPANEPYVLVEDKERTTENGITKFRTTKYADPTSRNYEPPKPGEQPKPVEIEESELVSPEWMRSRGYDPENESDVRRMQSDLNIQAWGNGAEAAMAVVPTRRTYMQTKSGTPETVTYGPNGRAITAVDFVKDGVPYREEYFHSGPRDTYVPGFLGDREALGIAELPGPSRDYIGINEPTGFRLTRNPGGESPEVLDEIKWDDGLGGFVRTSGDKRWRLGTSDRPEDLSFWDTGNGRGELYQEYLDGRVTQDEVRNELNWYIGELDNEFADTRGLDHDLNLLETVPRNRIRGVARAEDWGIVTEERQSDGTWANARSTVIPERAEKRLLAKHAQMFEGTPDDPPDDWLIEDFDMNGEPIPYDGDGTPMFATKAGRTRRNVQVASKAGDADRFALSRNFLAQDKVPGSLFGIPITADEGSWTDRDIAFFRKHPEAGGYYDMGDEGSPEDGSAEGAPVQADVPKKRRIPPVVKGPLHYGPPPPPSRGPYPGIANNPGNVEKHERRSDKTLFKGEIAGGVRPKRFANFSDPVDGLVAAATVLSRRAAGLAAKGLPFTIENYVPGYAPKSENDVEGYINNLSKYSGFARDQALDTGNADDMAKLLRNVVRFESGVPNSEWFTDDEYRRAARAMNRSPESAPSLPASNNRQASGGSTQTYEE